MSASQALPHQQGSPCRHKVHQHACGAASHPGCPAQCDFHHHMGMQLSLAAPMMRMAFLWMKVSPCVADARRRRKRRRLRAGQICCRRTLWMLCCCTCGTADAQEAHQRQGGGFVLPCVMTHACMRMRRRGSGAACLAIVQGLVCSEVHHSPGLACLIGHVVGLHLPSRSPGPARHKNPVTGSPSTHMAEPTHPPGANMAAGTPQHSQRAHACAQTHRTPGSRHAPGEQAGSCLETSPQAPRCCRDATTLSSSWSLAELGRHPCGVRAVAELSRAVSSHGVCGDKEG